PLARLATGGGVVGGGDRVEVAALLQHRQVRQWLADIHVALQRVPEGVQVVLVQPQGVDLAGQANLGAVVAMAQPEGVVMAAVAGRQQLHDGIKLVEGRHKGFTEAAGDGQGAGLAIELAAVVFVEAGVEGEQEVGTEDGVKGNEHTDQQGSFWGLFLTATIPHNSRCGYSRKNNKYPVCVCLSFRTEK